MYAIGLRVHGTARRKGSILEREGLLARSTVWSLGVFVLVECRWYTLQLKAYTGATWPRSILESSITPYLAFPTAITGTHNLESLVAVVFIHEDILLGVRSRRRRARSVFHSGEKLFLVDVTW